VVTFVAHLFARHLEDLAHKQPHILTSSLFTGEDEVFAFRRAVSRIYETQTHEYWRNAGPGQRAM
jgi:predicted ATPase